MTFTVLLDWMNQTAAAGEGCVLVTNRLQFAESAASPLLSEKSSKCISKLRRHHVCMNTDWCFFIRNTQMPLKFSPSEISGLSITEKTHTSGYFETTIQISSVTWNSYVFTITWSIPNQNTGVYSCYGFMQKQRIYFCNLFYWE